MKKVIVGILFLFFALSAFASYQDGLSAEQRGDFKAAIQAYLPLAQAGDVDSQLNLGYLYSTNFQDYANAFYWYSQAAKQNNPKAFESLGLLYLNGLGVAKDSQKALYYFRKGANAGDVYAMENLGVTLITLSDNNPETIQQGIYWMKRAAQSGDRVAQYNMGLFYTQGQYLPKDIMQGIEYYKQAAAQNEIEAIMNLGFLYESGDKNQLQPDYSQAYYWYTLAENLGDVSAKNALQSLKEKMTATQIAAGEHLLENHTHS